MIETIISKVKDTLKKLRFKRTWRKRNPHNFKNAESIFVIENVTVGKGTYGQINVQNFYRPEKLTIGNYCSIANKIEFLLGGNHNTKCVSTYSFGPRVYNNYHSGGEETISRKLDIIVEEDVWIGYGALILS